MKGIATGLAALVLCLAAPALGDVKAGVDAWGQGDYAKAIETWRPLAEAGDADAQFNLGQAYKTGKGVPADDTVALEWFRKAAAQGHKQAEDNYGRLLFQVGQRQEAMPYIQRSADRGDARARYLLATAHFNGEYVGKDWVRAYALMSLSAASGLGPAQSSLSQMDRHVPADQRQKGLTLAKELEQQEQALALAATVSPPVPAKPVTATTPVIRPAPQPVRTAEIPASGPATPAIAPTKPTPAKPAPKPAPAPVAAKPVKQAATGSWRVQMGAFSEESRAQALWKSLSAKVSGLAAHEHYLVKGGNVTRLQAGPLSDQAAAEKLCKAIKAAGTDCLTKKM